MIPSPPPGKQVRRLCASLLVGLLAFLFYQTLRHALGRGEGNDLSIFLYSSGLFFGGHNPYGIYHGLLYPLFAPFLFAPLLPLPAWLAHTAWFCASIGTLYMGLNGWSRVRGVAPSATLLLLAALLLFTPLQSNLRNGQVNLLLLAGALGFVVALAKGKEWSAALFLGAIIATKLVPAIFIIMLAIDRRWGVILKTALIAALLLFVLPPLVVGGKAIDYYATYATVLGQPSGNREGALPQQWLFPAVLAGAALLHLRYRPPLAEAFPLYGPAVALAGGAFLQSHHLAWLFPAALIYMERGLTLPRLVPLAAAAALLSISAHYATVPLLAAAALIYFAAYGATVARRTPPAASSPGDPCYDNGSQPFR